MPWKKVTADHWQNHSDTHLFFDKDIKCVVVERWIEKHGVSMTVIPIDPFMDFLRDNRYHCFPEAAMIALRNKFERFREANVELLETADKAKEQAIKTKELRTDLRITEESLNTVLEIAENSAKKTIEEMTRRRALETELKQVKESIPKIVCMAQAEMDKLKVEVKRLKEKCGET